MLRTQIVVIGIATLSLGAPPQAQARSGLLDKLGAGVRRLTGTSTARKEPIPRARFQERVLNGTRIKIERYATGHTLRAVASDGTHSERITATGVEGIPFRTTTQRDWKPGLDPTTHRASTSSFWLADPRQREAMSGQALTDFLPPAATRRSVMRQREARGESKELWPGSSRDGKEGTAGVELRSVKGVPVTVQHLKRSDGHVLRRVGEDGTQTKRVTIGDRSTEETWKRGKDPASDAPDQTRIWSRGDYDHEYAPSPAAARREMHEYEREKQAAQARKIAEKALWPQP